MLQTASLVESLSGGWALFPCRTRKASFTSRCGPPPFGPGRLKRPGRCKLHSDTQKGTSVRQDTDLLENALQHSFLSRNTQIFPFQNSGHSNLLFTRSFQIIEPASCKTHRADLVSSKQLESWASARSSRPDSRFTSG